MDDKWNYVKPGCCNNWLVLPTVYSDALSYKEQLDKFCYQLNKLIANNNILPDFINEMIKEYISSGAIGEVVRDILADYILNVKYPPEGITPAVGDGSADDTEAIQGCIDYAAENGGVVYFPYGAYLTQSLTMKDGVSLFGFDRYSTKIVLKGGATKPLINGNVTDLSIANLTLDGNSGIQVNDVNVVTITGSNVLFTNLIIKDGYTLVNYKGADGHFQISNVVLGNAVEKCLVTSGNTIIQAKNMLFNQLSAVGGVCVVEIGTNGGVFDLTSVANCNKCIVINGNRNKIDADVENAVIPFEDNGLQNNVEIFGKSCKEFYSGNVDVSISGNKSEIITGTVNYTFSDDKTINGKNITENLTGKKTIAASDVFLNPINPLTYKTPNSGNVYDTIPFKDPNGHIYKIMVENNKTKNLDNYHTFEEFGAVGDGITDDTQAFNQALSSDYTSFKLLANKTYLISNVVYITKNNTHIIGEENSCVKCADNSFNNMWSLFVIQGNPLSNIELSNFTLDGNSENNIDYGDPVDGNLDKNYGGKCLALINFTNCTLVNLHNLYIKNAWNCGIWLSDCVNSIVHDNILMRCRVHGVSVRNNETFSIVPYNNAVYNNIVGHSVVGVEIIFGVYNVICNDNVIFACSDMEKFPSYAFNGSYPNIYPKDSRFKTPSESGFVPASQLGDGAAIEATGSVTSQTAPNNNSIVYSGNTISDCSNGLRVEELSNDVTIVGNNVRDCSYQGIFIFSGRKISITSNVINYNKIGVHIDNLTDYPTPSDCLISNNEITDNSEVGVKINCNSCIIAGNNFNDNALGIYSDKGCKNMLLNGNTFYDYYAKGNLKGADLSNVDFTKSKVINNIFDVNTPVVGLNKDTIHAYNNNVGIKTKDYGVGSTSEGSENNYPVTVNIDFPFAPDTGSLMITPITDGLTASIESISASSFTVICNKIGSFNWYIDTSK